MIVGHLQRLNFHHFYTSLRWCCSGNVGVQVVKIQPLKMSYDHLRALGVKPPVHSTHFGCLHYGSPTLLTSLMANMRDGLELRSRCAIFGTIFLMPSSSSSLESNHCCSAQAYTYHR